MKYFKLAIECPDFDYIDELLPEDQVTINKWEELDDDILYLEGITFDEFEEILNPLEYLVEYELKLVVKDEDIKFYKVKDEEIIEEIENYEKFEVL